MSVTNLNGHIIFFARGRQDSNTTSKGSLKDLQAKETKIAQHLVIKRSAGQVECSLTGIPFSLQSSSEFKALTFMVW